MDMEAVPFFTPDITVTPHSLSTELADMINRPITIGEFQQRTGNQGVSVYLTEDWELVIRTRLPDGRELFVQGPEQFRACA